MRKKAMSSNKISANKNNSNKTDLYLKDSKHVEKKNNRKIFTKRIRVFIS